MAKKERSPIELLEELVVKFGQVFSSDMYIYKRKKCIPGNETSENLLGDIILTLEGKWENVLTELGIPDIFYIGNIKEFRAKFKDKTITMEELHTSGDHDPSIESVLLEKITEIETEHMNEENVWKHLVEIPDFMETIFDKKLIYLYQIPHDDGTVEEISLAKQMFPMMTEKTAIDTFILIKESKDYDGLYDILVDFTHTHFRIQSVYHALATPKVNQEDNQMELAERKMELHYEKKEKRFYLREAYPEDAAFVTPSSAFVDDWLGDFWMCARYSCGITNANRWYDKIRKACSVLYDRSVRVGMIYEVLKEYHKYAFHDAIVCDLSEKFIIQNSEDHPDELSPEFWEIFKSAMQRELIVIFNGCGDERTSYAGQLCTKWASIGTEYKGIVFTLERKTGDRVTIVTHYEGPFTYARVGTIEGFGVMKFDDCGKLINGKSVIFNQREDSENFMNSLGCLLQAVVNNIAKDDVDSSFDAMEALQTGDIVIEAYGLSVEAYNRYITRACEK